MAGMSGEADMGITRTDGDGARTYSFARIPAGVDDLRGLDITDEYLAACATVFALAAFESDPEAGKAMLEYMNGPADVSAFDIDFIKGQMRQYPYVMRSYFNGATPENGYAVAERVSLTIAENPYSRDEEGYVRLLLRSGGADTERPLTLRRKASTGEWFAFSDSYRGLLAGIRAPKGMDGWD